MVTRSISLSFIFCLTITNCFISRFVITGNDKAHIYSCQYTWSHQQHDHIGLFFSHLIIGHHADAEQRHLLAFSHRHKRPEHVQCEWHGAESNRQFTRWGHAAAKWIHTHAWWGLVFVLLFTSLYKWVSFPEGLRDRSRQLAWCHCY